MREKTALQKFMDQNISLKAIATGLVAGGITFVALGQFDGLISESREAAISDPVAGYDAARSADIKSALGQSQDRKSHLEAANEAVAKMASALDQKNGAYPDGLEGVQQRERDFVDASNAYEQAMKQAGQPVGPDTSFKMDEFQFSLNAIEALGGDVDEARATGTFSTFKP